MAWSGYCPNICLEENYQKEKTVARVLARIQTKYLSNTNIECYHSTSLLGVDRMRILSFKYVSSYNVSVVIRYNC